MGIYLGTRLAELGPRSRAELRIILDRGNSDWRLLSISGSGSTAAIACLLLGEWRMASVVLAAALVILYVLFSFRLHERRMTSLPPLQRPEGERCDTTTSMPPE